MKKIFTTISFAFLVSNIICGQQTIPASLNVYNLELKEKKVVANDTTFYIYFDPAISKSDVENYSLIDVDQSGEPGSKIVKIDTVISQTDVVEKDYTNIIPNFYRAGIIGLWSISTEAFEEANTSARLSVFVKPYIHSNLFLSFNKNATTGDSINPESILFPETGNSALLLTYDIFNIGWADKYNNNSQHFVTPFTEFSWQNTKNTKTDTLYHFSTLSLTLGGKYTWNLLGVNETEDDKKTQNIALVLAPSITYLNVLNKDYNDFVTLFGNDLEIPDGEVTGESLTSVKSDLFYWGAKIEFTIAEFSIYASFKSPFQSDEHIPMRAFKGSNLMIGTTLQGSILKFK